MAELKKIIIDGVQYDLPAGGGGGDSNHIIEVENLPTENIDEGAMYKLHTLKIYAAINEDIVPFERVFGTPAFTVIVDTLPTTGEVVTQTNKVILYYSKEANSIYGYLDDEAASSLGGSAGWYPADMLLTASFPNLSYAGIFLSYSDIKTQGEGAFICAAWAYLFYVYKDGQFISFEPDLPIYRGEGGGSVIFSDPLWSNASGGGAVAMGNETNASGDCSLAGGFGTFAKGSYSFAFGSTITADGDYSHAEGQSTLAGGMSSHAEGQNTEATGNYSHSEGCRTHATNTSAHAEGYDTYATHIASHAEGENTTASGYSSHSEGYGTIASGETQHVQGRYNISDTNNKYAHIVGNGIGPGITGNNGNTERSNAHTLDWEGNAWFKGNIRVGGNIWDEGVQLATQSELTNNYYTKSEVDSKITNTGTNVDLSNQEVEGDTWKIVDGADNIVAQIDENGLTVTKINVQSNTDNFVKTFRFGDRIQELDNNKQVIREIYTDVPNQNDWGALYEYFRQDIFQMTEGIGPDSCVGYFVKSYRDAVLFPNLEHYLCAKIDINDLDSFKVEMLGSYGSSAECTMIISLFTRTAETYKLQICSKHDLLGSYTSSGWYREGAKSLDLSNHIETLWSDKEFAATSSEAQEIRAAEKIIIANQSEWVVLNRVAELYRDTDNTMVYFKGWMFNDSFAEYKIILYIAPDNTVIFRNSINN